jgi:hypothetical protein
VSCAVTKTLINVATAKTDGAATNMEITTETQLPRAEVRVVYIVKNSD